MVNAIRHDGGGVFVMMCILCAAIMLRTSKLSGAGRRKVQEYDLSCYRMVTSAFSSSSGTLGPKTGGGNYHFTIHAAADYTFAAVDELCMLSWIAALKEVLLPPVHQHGMGTTWSSKEISSFTRFTSM